MNKPTEHSGEESTSRKTHSLKVFGRSICYSVTFIYLISLHQLEIERFSSEVIFDSLRNTWTASIVAAIAIPIVWAIAGLIVRKKNVRVLSRKQTISFLSKSLAFIVLFSVTIPSLIEGCGNTFPIATETVFYFLLLAMWTFFLALTNLSSYREEPSRQSVFFLCLTVIILIASFWVLWVIVDAIAASALT